MNSDGYVNNLWNVGALILITNITSHQIMVWLETKDFNLFLIFWYVFSFGLLFVTIWLNDNSSGGVYGHNQWAIMMTSPLFYLILFLQVFVICMPRYLEICLNSTLFYPEFTKIKGD